MKNKIEILTLYQGMVSNMNTLRNTLANPPADMSIADIQDANNALDCQHQMNSVIEWVLGIEKCWTIGEVENHLLKEKENDTER